MKIAVIGTGYVGLVGGTCFAEAGNEVICVDNNPEKLRMLRAGEIPIYEPGLEVLFERNTKEGRLHFTDNLSEAVAFAEIIFLSLPTPPMEDGSADLKYVLEVAGQIGQLITEYKIIVNKSTVPVGTVERVRSKIAAATSMEVDVVSNPEFLREGAAVNDFMHPERIVIGTDSAKAKEKLTQLYRPFVQSESQILYMDAFSSELTKYAANSFLAMKISFMNEVANLCERVGADVDKVRLGIGSDSRIGPKFLFAGAGYGGACFPKDVSALYKTAKKYQYHFDILDAVMQVNSAQKHRLVEKVIGYYGEELKGKTFALWGLAFKPNTDDIRQAPALVIAEELLNRGATVVGYDPEAMWQVEKYTNLDITLAKGRYEALENADALIVVTEWKEFLAPDFGKIKELLKTPVIFDGRNIYSLEQMNAHGFYYNSIGRPAVGKKVTVTS